MTNEQLLLTENILIDAVKAFHDLDDKKKREQEQNGLYTYDRKPKFEPKEIYKIFARKAAIEE